VCERCHSAQKEYVNYRGAPPGIGIAMIATGFPTIAAAGLCIGSRCGNSPGLRLQQGKGALQFSSSTTGRDSSRMDQC